MDAAKTAFTIAAVVAALLFWAIFMPSVETGWNEQGQCVEVRTHASMIAVAEVVDDWQCR